MKTSVQALVALCGALFLGGCAFGNAHRYHDTTANLGGGGKVSVAVATHDQRPYVVAGKKAPNFTGLQRGGFGNPFDVGTASGKPLAEDMTHSIVQSFASNGIVALPVVVPHSLGREEVIAKLKAAGADRLLSVTIAEWKSDTYVNVALHYDIGALVMDRDGNQLAENHLKGKDDLGGSAWNPPEHAKEAVPKAFKEKLEQLLNGPELGAALR